MPKESAGVLLYRIRENQPEYLLVHPGGPFFKDKDAGSWSVPKGEIEANEPPEQAARREFAEETGFAPEGELVKLNPVKLKSGKVVHAWACKGDCQPAQIRSNTFQCEWPPRSGKFQEFPEIDRAEWFSLAEAKLKINPAQIPLLEQLQTILASQDAALT